MATVYLSPVGNGFQWLTTNALSVLAGGKINTYLAGTSTPATTWADITGSISNANPIILDASGRATNEIWFTAGQAYKFVITDALAVVQFTLDNLYGINDPALPLGSFISNLANTSDPTLGDALVGTKRTETGTVATTVHSWIQEQVLNVFDFMTIAQIADVQSRTASIDVTAAVNAADVAATASKKALYIPAGKYQVSSVTFNATHVFGDGWFPGAGTQFHGNTASSNVVVLSSTIGTLFENINISSSIAVGSRIGAGVKVTGGALIVCRNVYSVGHQYGFWNTGQGNEFEHCFGQANLMYGMVFDGGVAAQNEIGVYFCQCNGNTSDGIHFIGPGAGIYMVRPTCASNGGTGINFVNPTGNAPQALNDVFIALPEMSINAGNGIDNGANANSNTFNVMGGFIEVSGAAGITTGAATSTRCNIGNMTVNGSGSYGIVVASTNVSLTGLSLAGNTTDAIRLGANSAKIVISGCQMLNTTDGIQIDGGAAAFSMAACDLTAVTTPLNGTVPAGSKISACQNIVSTQGPAALTFTVSPGTTVAAATTTYMSSAGNTNTADVNFWKVPFKGTIRNLYVESGVFPGAGQTFTYTVRLGAVDQTITAQLAGAAQSTNSDTTHTVAVAAGDRIAVKLVTSAGAGVGAHWCGLELERTY